MASHMLCWKLLSRSLSPLCQVWVNAKKWPPSGAKSAIWVTQLHSLLAGPGMATSLNLNLEHAWCLRHDETRWNMMKHETWYQVAMKSKMMFCRAEMLHMSRWPFSPPASPCGMPYQQCTETLHPGPLAKQKERRSWEKQREAERSWEVLKRSWFQEFDFKDSILLGCACNVIGHHAIVESTFCIWYNAAMWYLCDSYVWSWNMMRSGCRFICYNSLVTNASPDANLWICFISFGIDLILHTQKWFSIATKGTDTGKLANAEVQVRHLPLWGSASPWSLNGRKVGGRSQAQDLPCLHWKLNVTVLKTVVHFDSLSFSCHTALHQSRGGSESKSVE